MNTFLLNPTLKGQAKFIREGRCMQKASSWATAWPPITLATLGALAQPAGRVRLLDGDVEPVTLDDILHEIEALDADLVVVNTGFPSVERDMAVAAAIKEAFPEVSLAAVGVYITLLGAEALQSHPCLDVGIVGEPEETFRDLVSAVGRDGGWEAIPGLAWRVQGEVRVNAPRPLIRDLDTLPFPARDLLHNDRYRLPDNNRPFTLINTARGCPFGCTYCIVRPYFGARVRRHSLDYVLREIDECVERHGIRELLFWEEAFTLDRAFVMGLCEALARRRPPVRWAATTRVTAVDAELLRAMKAAGCHLLGFGIESASQDILDRARKGQTIADARRAVGLCRRIGIKTMGHFIFGLPGETRQTARRTIDFMLRLKLDYLQAYCAVPYPKTPLGELARAKGWIRAAAWSAYDFGGDSIMDTDALTAEEVTHFRRRAFRRFYLRPWYILSHLLFSIAPGQLFRITAFGDWMGLVSRGRTARE